MKKDSAQPDNSLKRWLKTILINGALIYSLYALGFGLFPQFAFVFATIKIIYTILISIAVAALLAGGLALAFTNGQLGKLVQSRVLRKLYVRDGEVDSNWKPSYDVDKVTELESKLKGPLRWINLAASFAIMAFAFNAGFYYLMVVELLSEVFLAYFVETAKTTREHMERLERLMVKDALQD